MAQEQRLVRTWSLGVTAEAAAAVAVSATGAAGTETTPDS